MNTRGKKKRSDKKNILFVSSEAVPFSKSGGLADVCGALPVALADKGHNVKLVMPRYWCVNKSGRDMKVILGTMGVPMGRETVWCQVIGTRKKGVDFCFIDHEGFFGRAGLYDDGKWEYHDNAERFGFLSKAAVQLCKDLGFKPDIAHCNDWQTAIVPAHLKLKELNNPFFSDTASVFTIHNIGHQGVFPREKYALLDFGEENFTESKFESWGKVHFMKGGIFYADAITTVSPSYAEEILAPYGGAGLTPYLERRSGDITGILNGADYESWDPARDEFIPRKYSVEDMSGKSFCKRVLQERFKLAVDTDIPVIGMVTRLAHQKGLDLLTPVIKDIVRDMKVQFVILGTGEKRMENFLKKLPSEFPGSIGVWIGFDEQRAHLIEAGSDLFLMPSLYEPCGLNQIYSMKYGTLPVVREVGGLKDTVEQYDERQGSGTGFRFNDADPWAVYYTVGWAVSTYYDRRHHFDAMKRRAMKKEFSWEDAAAEYERVYEKAVRRRSSWEKNSFQRGRGNTIF